MKKLISIITLLTITSSVFANEGAMIKNVKFSGNGCYEDEAIAVFSPDQQVLSLLFDNYVVEAGGDSGVKRGYKECMVQMNLLVPDNTRVVIEKIDYRGYAMLPQVGRMNFSSSYFIEIPELNFKTQTFIKKHNKIGEIDEDLFFDQKIKNKLLKSKCGHDFSLNFESELMAMTNSMNDEVYVAMDSIDTGIDFHITYEPCEQSIQRSYREEEVRRRGRLRAQRINDSQIRQRQVRRERVCNARDCVRNTRVGNGQVSRPSAPSQRNTHRVEGETQASRQHREVVRSTPVDANTRAREDREARRRNRR